MFADFLPTAGDAIVNQLPKYRFMSGGQCSVPVTVRVIGGATGRFGTQHAATCESWFMHLPGLRVVDARRRPGSAYSLLRAAIDDDEPGDLLRAQGALRAQGPGDPRRRSPSSARPTSSAQGSDVTIVATLLMVERALAAAEALAADGIDAEVIDLRWLRPLDLPTVRASVEKTGRLVVAEEQVHAAGWGATIVCELTTAASPGPAAAPGQPARRLPDPVHPAARGPGRPVGRRHRRRPRGPASADDRGRRAGRSTARRVSDRRALVIERVETIALRAPLGRRFSGSAYSMDNRCTIVTRLSHGRRPRLGGLHRRHRRRAGDHRRDHPRRAGAAAASAGAPPTPRARGGRWSPSTNDILRDRGLALQAIACVDDAIWDVFGRALGLPLHRVWGSVTDTPADQRHRRLLPPRRRLSCGRPWRGYVAAGFAGVKFKVGGRTPDRGRRPGPRCPRGARARTSR